MAHPVVLLMVNQHVSQITILKVKSTMFSRNPFFHLQQMARFLSWDGPDVPIYVTVTQARFAGNLGNGECLWMMFPLEPSTGG